jgi:hypothetical protein
VVVNGYQSIYIYMGIDQAFMLAGYQPPAYQLCWRSGTASTNKSLLAGLTNRQQRLICAGGHEPPV